MGRSPCYFLYQKCLYDMLYVYRQHEPFLPPCDHVIKPTNNTRRTTFLPWPWAVWVHFWNLVRPLKGLKESILQFNHFEKVSFPCTDTYRSLNSSPDETSLFLANKDKYPIDLICQYYRNNISLVYFWHMSHLHGIVESKPDFLIIYFSRTWFQNM